MFLVDDHQTIFPGLICLKTNEQNFHFLSKIMGLNSFKKCLYDNVKSIFFFV